MGHRSRNDVIPDQHHDRHYTRLYVYLHYLTIQQREACGTGYQSQ